MNEIQSLLLSSGDVQQIDILVLYKSNLSIAIRNLRFQFTPCLQNNVIAFSSVSCIFEIANALRNVDQFWGHP